MRFADFTRLIQPIKQKIFLLIGRCILTAINNDEKTMKIQVTSLNDETISDVERFQEFGFESYPKTDSEAETVIGFINGNRDQGIAICVHDRALRPTDLAEGDACMYDADDNRVWLSSGILKMFAATESFLKGDTFDTWITGTLKAVFDAHIHTCAGAGNPSSAPTTPLTAPSGHLSTKIKGE